jgi:hypothetical protein
MRFRSVVQLGGKTATGIPVPSEVVEALGAGRRPAVVVTVNGSYSYRSSVGSMGGQLLLPFSAEHRAASGLAAGDEVDVDLALDTEPREVVVPDDLAEALRRHPAARSAFEGLSYSKQRWWVLGIEAAKKAETRQRKVELAVASLAAT